MVFDPEVKYAKVVKNTHPLRSAKSKVINFFSCEKYIFKVFVSSYIINNKLKILCH